MREELISYFKNFSSAQLDTFEQLPELYSEWNSQINVISRKDCDQLFVRHILHSLAIYRFLPFQPGTHILDIGTGGGFPGIPLAIAMPEVSFILSDSIGKKIKVVQEIANALGLKNVVAVNRRAEKISDTFDFVVSRAVAPLPELLAWSAGKFRRKNINALPNGLIALKGGDLSDELKGCGKNTELHDIYDFFPLPFFETKKIVSVSLV
ncbi:MAG: 16S rRNA (guanine(527)-N(7))-methyltransferase RsmG [Crocinitomicaceae bacterium]|nr:16S rRNA (guanine(527)-N(7))-methyltransferase RsmG [Crocinitomicaceae bacterium]